MAAAAGSVLGRGNTGHHLLKFFQVPFCRGRGLATVSTPPSLSLLSSSLLSHQLFAEGNARWTPFKRDPGVVRADHPCDGSACAWSRRGVVTPPPLAWQLNLEGQRLRSSSASL
ncbi:hypothetical protein J437_LFUL003860 [Ladona fulva]|uniref:Uncharacterized protein n=1 Tax=Ladona fulva TaxID=123851 RepID=A0A8K0K6F7_LADFU|nr:hypothetical protein J437_LFUL003860 [Ladona fulva]